MPKKIQSSPLIFLFVFVMLGVSCVDTKKAVYFNNIPNSEIPASVDNAVADPVIQSNDLLSISVTSINPEATLIFNTPNMPVTQVTTATGTTSQSTGYLVNKEGFIKFPVLGSLRAAGLTKAGLENELTKTLVEKKLLVDPIVNVRFLNFRVTVLGEVARPTVVAVASEKISLLEALGLAGDLTIYAKRDNVLLIREEAGKKIIRRINLNSEELLTSPYYYLKTNDVIYAEPNKSRVASSERTTQLLPIFISALSFLAIIVDRLLR